MPRRPSCLIIGSLVLMAIVLAAWVISLWRVAGWARYDETWVLPGSGMRELHTTERGWIIVKGRFEAARVQKLRAVIPAGSSAAGEPRHQAEWVWQGDDPGIVTTDTRRWHVTAWDDWRLGSFGWFRTGSNASIRVFSIPLWLVMLALGLPCWLALGRTAMAERRRRHGLCAACGYNCRLCAAGSPCPECGTAVTPRASRTRNP